MRLARSTTFAGSYNLHHCSGSDFACSSHVAFRPEINFRFNTEELHSAIAKVCASILVASFCEPISNRVTLHVWTVKDVTEAAALLDDPVFQDILGAHKDFLLHGEA